jgi:helicase
LTTPIRPGRLPRQAFFPVVTFGDAYPLDRLIRPFLHRVADVAMVSYHYACAITDKDRVDLPLFIDSGGFAAVFSDAVVEEDGGLGVIRRALGETVTPRAVLDLQHRRAAFGASLDFPIPPSLTDTVEQTKRLRLTLANADWMIRQCHPVGFLPIASVQGFDVATYRASAEAVCAMGFDALAIGGLVPRLSDLPACLEIVRAVREVAGQRHVHVFGVGKPDLVAAFLAAGADSTDSSSYVKAAADGSLWQGTAPTDPSPIERAHIAIENAILVREAAARVTRRPVGT